MAPGSQFQEGENRVVLSTTHGWIEGVNEGYVIHPFGNNRVQSYYWLFVGGVRTQCVVVVVVDGHQETLRNCRPQQLTAVFVFERIPKFVGAVGWLRRRRRKYGEEEEEDKNNVDFVLVAIATSTPQCYWFEACWGWRYPLRYAFDSKTSLKPQPSRMDS